MNPTPARGNLRRALATLAGVALLAAAVWACLRAGIDPARAWSQIRQADPFLVVALFALPLASWACTTGCFWALTLRHGRVGAVEMSALMSASWLLNYLPLKPGLAGRVAYHKAVNGIDVKSSIQVVGLAIACAGVSIAAGLLIATVVRPAWGAWATAGALASPLAVTGGMYALIRLGPPKHRHRGMRVLALCFRYGDLLAWAGRYLVAFELMGRSITPREALAIAAVSQAATLVPLIGNGLGLREWAVGLAAASLPAWFAGAGGRPEVALGLGADLLNRTAEVLVALPAGLWGAWWVARRVRSAGVSDRSTSPAQPDPSPGRERTD